MTRQEALNRLNSRVNVTWRQLAWLAAGVVPWMLTISIAVAVGARDNERQQHMLDARTRVVEEFQGVKNDVYWMKRAISRIERWMFGNTVIPQEQRNQPPPRNGEEEDG